MSLSYDEAVATVKLRRRALLETANEFRTRVSPAQLTEDALQLLDPQLSFLTRLKTTIGLNRLLSLAVLAGAGWLVGKSHPSKKDHIAARNAGLATPRVNLKEKKNDSGQHLNRDERNSRTGRQRQEAEPQSARPQTRGKLQRSLKAARAGLIEPQPAPQQHASAREKQKPQRRKPQP